MFRALLEAESKKSRKRKEKKRKESLLVYYRSHSHYSLYISIEDFSDSLLLIKCLKSLKNRKLYNPKYEDHKEYLILMARL
jgi:hypothetical protein